MTHDADGCADRNEVVRTRGKCSACRLRFTCYEPNHYPRRQYQLDAVANVVAAVAIGARSVAQAAVLAAASATSVRRWASWVAGLIAPTDVLAATRTIDPDAPAGAGLSASEPTSTLRARAAQVLASLEGLGCALVRRGVALVSRTGLGRVLEWQRGLHGDVVGLVVEPRRLSPPMGFETSARGT